MQCYQKQVKLEAAAYCSINVSCHQLFFMLPQGSRSEEPGDTEDNRESRGSDQDIRPGAGGTMTTMTLKVSHSRTD